MMTTGMTTLRICRSHLAAASVLLTIGVGGCFSDAPTLTGMATEESSGDGTSTGTEEPQTTATQESTTTGVSTTGGETTVAETTAADTTTGVDSSSDGGESSSESGEPVPACGNDIVEGDEECDGGDLAAATCESLGYVPGTLTCNKDCTFEVTECRPPRMVLVPEGEFEMGSMLLPDEEPVRMVYLDAFYMDEFEVSAADFAVCVAAGECNEPDDIGACNFGSADRGNHPINCVGWADADAYCNWVAGGDLKRLPTEAEWEKAARSDDARVYPWGDIPNPDCSRAVMNEGFGTGCGTGATFEVGSVPLGAAPYGSLDMAGNVWEWVADWYGPYDPLALENPTGPAGGIERIVRGGGWFHSSFENFTTTHRHEIDGDFNDQFIGFRCMQPLPPAP